MADKLKPDDDALVERLIIDVTMILCNQPEDEKSLAHAIRSAILPFIHAARSEGYAAAREDAAKLVDALSNDYFLAWREGHKGSSYLEGQSDGTDVAAAAIRNMGGEHGAD